MFYFVSMHVWMCISMCITVQLTKVGLLLPSSGSVLNWGCRAWWSVLGRNCAISLFLSALSLERSCVEELVHGSRLWPLVHLLSASHWVNSTDYLLCSGCSPSCVGKQGRGEIRLESPEFKWVGDIDKPIPGRDWVLWRKKKELGPNAYWSLVKFFMYGQHLNSDPI